MDIDLELASLVDGGVEEGQEALDVVRQYLDFGIWKKSRKL